jgi:uncharacterized membrane protein YagU involved in acid resistance
MLTETGTIFEILLWGLLATLAMTTIMYGSQGLGLSRLSLPFLVGTCVTANRDWAMVFGFILYTLGGWAFALLYVVIFESLNVVSWWYGAILGLLHGLFLLVVALPVMPHLHPRMASEYEEPGSEALLEPPGFLGLNYGMQTPLVTLIAQTTYGAILGACYQSIALANAGAT